VESGCSKPPTTEDRLVGQHKNARLTVQGRLTLDRMIEHGRPVAHVAHKMGISRTTAHRWWSRWLAEGEEEGRENRRADRRGSYDVIHSVADDHSRLAYSEVLANETGETCAGFSARAHAFFFGHGIDIQAVMTDNAFADTEASSSARPWRSTP
jgi:transposase-like protein